METELAWGVRLKYERSLLGRLAWRAMEETREKRARLRRGKVMGRGQAFPFVLYLSLPFPLNRAASRRESTTFAPALATTAATPSAGA